MLHILVIDDHPLFQEALTSVISQMAEPTECLTCRTLSEAFEVLAEGEADQLDLVVMDLNLPDVCGLDGLVQFRKAFPALPVVIISAEQDRTVIIETIAKGATGFICKSLSREEIADAITIVLSGQVYLPSSIIRAPLERPSVGGGQSMSLDTIIEKLTQRQQAVYKELINGHSNKEIAYRLGVAEPTVKAHVSAIFNKLGVTSRTQAILMAKKETTHGDHW